MTPNAFSTNSKHICVLWVRTTEARYVGGMWKHSCLVARVEKKLGLEGRILTHVETVMAQAVFYTPTFL